LPDLFSVFSAPLFVDDWPEFQGAGRKGIWKETGIIGKFDSPGLKPVRENLTATPPGRWSTSCMIQNGEWTWMLNERGELIIAHLTGEGFHEISRAKVIEPATELRQHSSGFVLICRREIDFVEAENSSGFYRSVEKQRNGFPVIAAGDFHLPRTLLQGL